MRDEGVLASGDEQAEKPYGEPSLIDFTGELQIGARS
jgi:hypothetical protein